MRTIISLAVGFWLGRQIYIQYDKEQSLKKEQIVKQKLKSLLEESGFSEKEAEQKFEQLQETSK